MGKLAKKPLERFFIKPHGQTVTEINPLYIAVADCVQSTSIILCPPSCNMRVNQTPICQV